MEVPSYTKVAALGHRSVSHVFDGPVEITEKIDGSQFAFGVVAGELSYRSKGRQIPRHSVSENDLFYPIVQHVEDLYERGAIPEDYWFYGETLRKPRHSTLRYNRVPKGHFALWAARHSHDESAWFPHGGLETFADALECEVAQRLTQWGYEITELETVEDIVNLMKEKPESQLGGVAMEGVVIKNLNKEMLYGPILFPITAAKFVSEAFKEVHQKDWKRMNTGKGKWQDFQDQFATEARWIKGVQAMAEMGILKGEPSDIGQLLNFIQKDIGQECKEEIMRFLWKQFGKDLLRNAIRGVPEWYKEQLALGNIDQYLSGE